MFLRSKKHGGFFHEERRETAPSSRVSRMWEDVHDFHLHARLSCLYSPYSLTKIGGTLVVFVDFQEIAQKYT